VVDYSRVEQAQVADEIDALLENARIVDWLADYAVLRAQVRACG
jgi:thioester reductase-like protein